MTLRTSAPYSPKMRAIVGPAIMRHNSRTLMPSRIRGFLDEFGGNGTGGDSLSRQAIVHGGCFVLVRP